MVIKSINTKDFVKCAVGCMREGQGRCFASHAGRKGEENNTKSGITRT